MENLTEKSCLVCCKIQSIDNFYRNHISMDGYERRCKTCRSLRKTSKKKILLTPAEKKWLLKIKIHKPSLSDYAGMYRLLKNLGYDIETDISKQFCEKNGLHYRQRAKRAINLFSLDEVKSTYKI